MAIPPPPFWFAGPWVELVYTLVIVLLCFLVYFKTKELYDLTKHKGIKYFRLAFLLFGIAYATRLLTHLIMIGHIGLDFMMPHNWLVGLSMTAMSYLSTMAMVYLIYSTIWKKFNSMGFLLISNAAALMLFAISFFTRSLDLITLVQLLLLLATVIISTILHRKDKMLSKTRVLYLLVSVFWLMSLFIVGPIRFRFFEIELLLRIISIAIFAIIYYRVSKWTV
jgi:hypothetical protein